MIVYETQEHFVMTEQDAHARLAGDFARAWQSGLIAGGSRWNETLIAVAEHDRSWRSLDKAPLWNDAERRPYSFMDLPDDLKWPHYRVGLDEFEQVAPPFSALLCSLHYRSFAKNIRQAAAQSFSESERKRQERLLRVLRLDSAGSGDDADSPNASPREETRPPIIGPEKPTELRDVRDAAAHLQILQFCDRLSLYVCLNGPGTSPPPEFSWDRKGIPHSESLPFANGALVVPSWENPREIRLSRSPFPPSFEASIAVKEVRKPDIAARGIRAAYEDTPPVLRIFRFLA